MGLVCRHLRNRLPVGEVAEGNHSKYCTRGLEGGRERKDAGRNLEGEAGEVALRRQLEREREREMCCRRPNKGTAKKIWRELGAGRGQEEGRWVATALLRAVNGARGKKEPGRRTQKGSCVDRKA